MKANIPLDSEHMMGYKGEGFYPASPQSKKKSCFHSACCICLPCCPLWIRWFCCMGLVGIVTVIVIVGSLVALFKIPTVEYNGLVDDPHGAPRFKVDDVLAPTAFEINLGFNMGVVNPNIESAHFESLKATAYYPTALHQPVGGGQVTELTISPYSITNFTFPFHIQYNPNNETAEMLQDIVDRCGLSGFPVRDITVLYDLTPTVRLFGLFPLSVTIRRQANIPCPIDSNLFHGLT